MIKCQTEFRRACNSQSIHDGATVWIFKDFLSGLLVAAIKARLTLSSKDANKHAGQNHIVRGDHESPLKALPH